MEYLTTLRRLRRLSFTAFLINVAIVSIWWAFVLTNLMQYFMWSVPGMTLEGANEYIMWLMGAMHIVAIVLFLIPTIALSIEIGCEKKPKAKKRK